MAGSFSDFLELEILDHVFSAATYTPPVTLYVGLWTAALSDASVGTAGSEVSGGGYARVAVTNNATNFPAASSGSKSNGTTITFPTASASWGTATYCGLTDAVTGGNMLAWADLNSSKSIASGDTASFSIGALTITLT